MAPNESKFAKQGECRVVGCYKKTVVLYNTSRFCTEHHATYLQGLRALQAEKQLICLFPKCDKPPHGRMATCQSHWEAEIELERPIMTLEEIDEESDRIVNNIVARIDLGKFKIGFTAQRKLRLSAYIKELKQSCILEPLIELKNAEEACLMEAAVIHKIMFHADLNVREKLMNVTGDGKGTIIPKTRCWLYILTVEDDDKFTRGCDISTLPINVFEEMLEVALENITPLLTDRCFGIGATSHFDDRMLAHNKNKIFDYVAKKDFHKYALFKSGDKIVTREGEIFVLKPIDIIKFEVFAHTVLRLKQKYQTHWLKCKTFIGGDGIRYNSLGNAVTYYSTFPETISGEDNSSSNIIEEDG
ncbi:hypothetical protein PVAND_006985 [Polypedilum vanderplanki]|uniref:Uncharacterized protein n=1 Tax=Polypedilum vanderplanki TaxID=319348 RepID=A0A9J6C5F4_POLVA|nr:hypothetical protein PVAND_006985 [Polypedilum vanderplanki]